MLSRPKWAQAIKSDTIVMDEGLIVTDGNTRQIMTDEKFLKGHGLEIPRCKAIHTKEVF